MLKAFIVLQVSSAIKKVEMLKSVILGLTLATPIGQNCMQMLRK